jgi:hypothetical protein
MDKGRLAAIAARSDQKPERFHIDHGELPSRQIKASGHLLPLDRQDWAVDPDPEPR